MGKFRPAVGEVLLANEMDWRKDLFERIGPVILRVAIRKGDTMLLFSHISVHFVYRSFNLPSSLLLDCPVESGRPVAHPKVAQHVLDLQGLSEQR